MNVRFLIRFLNKYGDLKQYKFSAIDPLRAAQATLSTGMSLQSLSDGVIGNYHEKLGPEVFPWKTLAGFPAGLKYNMDEVGVNGLYKRLRKVGTTRCVVIEFR